MIGIAPPTVASYRSATRFFCASADSSWNARAIGPLLEVTMCLFFASAALIYPIAGSPVSAFVGVTSMRTSYSAFSITSVAVIARSPHTPVLRLFSSTAGISIPSSQMHPLFESAIPVIVIPKFFCAIISAMPRPTDPRPISAAFMRSPPSVRSKAAISAARHGAGWRAPHPCLNGWLP